MPTPTQFHSNNLSANTILLWASHACIFKKGWTSRSFTRFARDRFTSIFTVRICLWYQSLLLRIILVDHRNIDRCGIILVNFVMAATEIELASGIDSGCANGPIHGLLGWVLKDTGLPHFIKHSYTQKIKRKVEIKGKKPER